MRSELFFEIYIKQAIENIRSHLMRSFLTLLGVLVGTAAVVALLTGSELATQTALAQFKKLGTDILSLSIFDSPSEISQTADASNLPEIEKINVTHIISEAPYTLHYSSIIFAGNKLDVSALGVTQELQAIMKLQIAKGRFVSNLDNKEFFCVLGNEVAKNLNDNPENLLGNQIKLDNYFFTVIGILQPAEKNMFLFSDPNQSIFIPIKTSLLLYKNAKVKNVIFKIDSEKSLQQAQNEIESQLQSLLPNTKTHFSSPENIVKNMEKQNQIFTLLLGFIGCISLIVGGIGVMNIMLVSVSERRREIGLRITVGATEKNILFLFLVEAAVLATIGGVIGIILGEGLAFCVAEFSHWEFQLLISPILIGFIVSVLVGIFFGYYPAKKAAQLNPIEILRGN